jgi:hypothetical protein
MSKHEEPEREVEDMERLSAQVGDDIEAAREDWERKKADDSIPGAAGMPNKAEGGLPPEADYVSSGEGTEDKDGGSMPPPDPYETD